jgi:hypothetical protein
VIQQVHEHRVRSFLKERNYSIKSEKAIGMQPKNYSPDHKDPEVDVGFSQNAAPTQIVLAIHRVKSTIPC